MIIVYIELRKIESDINVAHILSNNNLSSIQQSFPLLTRFCVRETCWLLAVGAVN